MKNGSMMTTGNQYEIGSWKCGKGKAFTPIPTYFIILLEINSIKNHLIKRQNKPFD